MVDPISSTLIMSKLVEAASGFLSGYATERAKVAATVTQRREQMALDREKLYEGMAGAERLEQMRLAAAAEEGRAAALRDKIRDLEQHLRANYPMQDGPGALRSTLLKTGSEENSLVVLLALQSDDPGSQNWNGLRARVRDELMQFQNKGLIRIRMPERPFEWPHAALYEHDLFGIPTLVLQIAVGHRFLSVNLGGCDLSSPGPQETMRIYGMRASAKDDWNEVEITQINDTSKTGQRFRLRAPEDADDVRELDHELASRAISLVVATAIDAFYLMHREGYAEQIDDAISSASLVAEDFPADLSMDLDLVVDPAYHLMHTAARRARRGDPDGAVRELRRACVVLLGALADENAETPALMRRAMTGPDTLKHHRDKLFRVVFELPEKFTHRDALVDALTTPTPLPTELPPVPEPEKPSRPARATAPSPMHRPGASGRSSVSLPGNTSWTRQTGKSPLDDDD